MPKLNFTTCVNAFKGTAEKIEEWNSSSNSNIKWHGRLVKAIDQETFESIESLCGLSSTGSDSVHEDAREIVLAIDEFALRFAEFNELVASSSPTVQPSGTPEMWSAFEAIRSRTEKWAPKPIEPVAILVERDRVPAWQVCKIYGWGSEEKGWETQKVQEELDNPGIHTGENWENPAVVRHKAAVDAEWSKRKPVLNFASASEFSATKKPAPETLQTLITQRVGIEQIMAMKGVSREEVEHEAAKLGVTLAGARFVRPSDPAGIASEQSADEGQQEKEFSDKQLKAMKQAALKRLKQLQGEKKPMGEIAAIMADEFPAVDTAAILPANA